jgi:hypothetical protein
MRRVYGKLLLKAAGGLEIAFATAKRVAIPRLTHGPWGRGSQEPGYVIRIRDIMEPIHDMPMVSATSKLMPSNPGSIWGGNLRRKTS